ncbi:MAG: transglutaminase family protein, partial [Candidatus Zixiibacteriota bacterium]
ELEKSLREYLKPQKRGQNKPLRKINLRESPTKDSMKLGFLDTLERLFVGTADAAEDAFTPADLAETIDVQFTPEIQQLAAELDHNPVKIYNWVRNNIDFVPTWGSILGADFCRQVKKGNAFDTSSLLIALLRVSGIPARYQFGTIEAPIEEAMNWLGDFTDPNAAASLVASGGIPSATVVKHDGVVTSITMEHVWVKASVDFFPSRGAVQVAGDTWIDLDASFKQYLFIDGIDVENVVSFDAQAFMDALTATATVGEDFATNVDANFIQTTLDDLDAQLSAYIEQNNPDISFLELVGGKQIITKDHPVLLGTLPYRTIATAQPVSEIPDGLRHKMTFEVTPAELDVPDFSYTASLPELAGKRITLSYTAATPEDATFVASLIPEPLPDGTITFPDTLPGYLINLVPNLKIEGETVATGSSVQMGSQATLTTIFQMPNDFGNIRLPKKIIAGSYHAVVLNLAGVSGEEFERRIEKAKEIRVQLKAGTADGIDTDDIYGGVYHQVGQSYWGMIQILGAVAEARNDVVVSRYPSRGVFSHLLKAERLFGIPVAVSDDGVGTDIDYDAKAVSSRTGNREQAFTYMISTGMTGSILEPAIWELWLYPDPTGRGISTAHILAFANQNGINILRIDQDDLSTVLSQLQLAPDVKEEIENAVAAGKIVTVPQSEVTKEGWTGTGYILLDPTTGSASYRISGGTAGGVLGLIKKLPLDPFPSYIYDSIITVTPEIPALQTRIPKISTLTNSIGYGLATLAFFQNILNVDSEKKLSREDKILIMRLITVLMTIQLVIGTVAGPFAPFINLIFNDMLLGRAIKLIIKVAIRKNEINAAIEQAESGGEIP